MGRNKNNKRKIKINYSTFNKLKLLGSPSYHINLFSVYEDITKDYITDVTKLTNNDKIEILNLLMRERHNNISNIIYKFLRLLNRIINGHYNKKSEEKDVDPELDYFINKYESLVNKYNNKFNNLEISDNGKHTVLKHWKGIIDVTVPNKSDIDNVNNKSLN